MVRDDFSHIPRYRQLPPAPLPHGEDSAPIVIVGAGPVGLTLALDLGQRGHRVVVLERLDFISAGSKAICFAHRTLDIWNRLGVVEPMIETGVSWDVGKVFRGDRGAPIYQFNTRPAGSRMPGFINLQQYRVEEILYEAVSQLPNVELRYGHQVRSFDANATALSVEAQLGTYRISASWIVACDGVRSSMRTLMKLDFEGRVFEDNFLIADVRLEASRPAERWFWFDPPWGGASALMHKQPGGIWRLDFQLGWDIDRQEALRDENVERLVRGMLGEDVEFEKEWYSVYTFQCRRMRRFVHGRVLFAGDAAHVVSPFGARGCNGGIADADNMAWKLDAVLGGASPELLETYDHEAVLAADENILNSSRSTDFMTPKSKLSSAFRNAVLDMSESQPFARPFVNSGRLSQAISYPDSPLNAAEVDPWEGGLYPGSPAVDCRTEDGWLLDRLGGEWRLLVAERRDDSHLPQVVLRGAEARHRYALSPGGAYLIRPDQYVAARWKTWSPERLREYPWLI